MLKKTKKISERISVMNGEKMEHIEEFLNDLDNAVSELELKAYRKGAVSALLGVTIGAIGLKIISGTLGK